MPIHRFALPLALLALLLTAAPAFADLTWERRAVSIEAEPGQAVIEAAFAFENTSDEPVTITRVSSSCGCTTPRLDKRTYAPGETGAIAARFEIGHRTGRHSSRIIVRTAPAPGSSGSPGSGARSNSTTTLTLRSEIPELVRLRSPLVHWRPDEPREPKRVPLELGHEAAMAITGVRSDSELISASLETVEQEPEDERADEAQQRPRYELTLTPTGEPGRAEVLIDVALPAERTRTVSLPARVLPGPKDAQTSEANSSEAASASAAAE